VRAANRLSPSYDWALDTKKEEMLQIWKRHHSVATNLLHAMATCDKKQAVQDVILIRQGVLVAASALFGCGNLAAAAMAIYPHVAPISFVIHCGMVGLAGSCIGVGGKEITRTEDILKRLQTDRKELDTEFALAFPRHSKYPYYMAPMNAVFPRDPKYPYGYPYEYEPDNDIKTMTTDLSTVDVDTLITDLAVKQFKKEYGEPIANA
jgi:hypothetical protein